MKANPRRRQFKALEAIEIEPSDDSGNDSDDDSNDAPTVILLHGYGADMADLASLAEVIQVPSKTHWIFPNAPLTVPLGGHFVGRGWFPLSISDLQKAAVGKEIEFSLVPPGLSYASDLVLELIEELQLDTRRLVIGGFSQGAMVATDVALRLSQPPAGLAVLSGAPLNEIEWRRQGEALRDKVAPRRFSFFQSHGVSDPVLSFQAALRLEKLFLESGWSGQLLRFPGGHEIPPEVIRQLGGYLRRSLAGPNGKM